MDYLQSLELQMAALQRKIRLLQELRFFVDSASPDEFAAFGEELRSVYAASGANLASVLASLVGVPAGDARSPIPAPAPAADRSRQEPTFKSAAAAQGGEPAPRPLPSEASLQNRSVPKNGAPQNEGAPTDAAGASASAEALGLIESAMVSIPASSFIMGSEASDEEKPPHKVNLGPYRICDHLVTNKEYSLFLAANPQWRKDRADPELRDDRYLEDWNSDSYPEGKDDNPVAFVSFFAARAFVEWIGKRLPTEAEWECAARGGLVGKRYPNGDLMNDKLANLAKQYRGTTPARRFEPNGFKLYDMAGNLFEWCSDCYGPYAPGEARDPKGPDEGDFRVARGGSWMSGAGALRVSARVDMEDVTCGQVGIRPADSGPA